MRKRIIIICLIVLVLIIGAFIYFVSGVSSVSPPIKKYEYAGTVDQLVSGIRKYINNNPGINLKITDTTGGSNGYAIYMTIEMKNNDHDIEYGWKCEKDNNDKSAKTSIKLVEAYDIKNNTGGYIKEAKGVKLLLDVFESKFLLPLKNEQNMNIISL